MYSSSPSISTFTYVSKKRSIYDVLGVDTDADEDDIKKAYYQLALKYHPDRNKHDGDAEIKFKEILEAYEVIRSPEKRLLYDRDTKCVTNSELVEANLSRSPGALFDAVDNFFTRSGYISPTIQDMLANISTTKRKARGRNLRTTVHTSFQEVVYGCVKIAEVTRLAYCSYCKGTGELFVDEPEVNGIPIPGSRPPSPSNLLRRSCSYCLAVGRISINRGIQVEIPPGVKRGDEQFFEGEGDVGEFGAPPGDLVVVFDTPEHPFFKRDGDDVIVDFYISFTQASLGTNMHIPSLYGMMDIGVPSGTQPNDILRVSDQGFYNSKTKKRGNMLLKLNVKIPSQLTEHQKALLHQFMLTENNQA